MSVTIGYGLGKTKGTNCNKSKFRTLRRAQAIYIRYIFKRPNSLLKSDIFLIENTAGVLIQKKQRYYLTTHGGWLLWRIYFCANVLVRRWKMYVAGAK